MRRSCYRRRAADDRRRARSSEDVTSHTLRHSVAYRMLNVEDGNTFYDVRNRLRHASLQTTERVYDHIDRV